MRDGQVAPETKGVAVKLLASVDLGPRSRAWQGARFECVW